MKTFPLDNILKWDGYYMTPQVGKIIAKSINKDPLTTIPWHPHPNPIPRHPHPQPKKNMEK